MTCRHPSTAYVEVDTASRTEEDCIRESQSGRNAQFLRAAPPHWVWRRNCRSASQEVI